MTYYWRCVYENKNLLFHDQGRFQRDIACRYIDGGVEGNKASWEAEASQCSQYRWKTD